jgi:hypothetical protein
VIANGFAPSFSSPHEFAFSPLFLRLYMGPTIDAVTGAVLPALSGNDVNASASASKDGADSAAASNGSASASPILANMRPSIGIGALVAAALLF